MDYILVMEKGQLVEQGTLAELIEKMATMFNEANERRTPMMENSRQRKTFGKTINGFVLS